MASEAETARQVKTRAVLIDPVTLTVVWMNEAAARSMLGREAGFTPGMPAEAVVTIAGTHDVTGVIEEVARSGNDAHLSVDLVSTGRGSVTVTTSISQLPGGMLLLLSDNAWQAKAASGEEGAVHRSARRGR